MRSPVAAGIFHEDKISDRPTQQWIATVNQPPFEQRLFKFDDWRCERPRRSWVLYEISISNESRTIDPCGLFTL
jgi:hypothetical protein